MRFCFLAHPAGRNCRNASELLLARSAARALFSAPSTTTRCPHTYTAFSSQAAAIYERMKLVQRSCQGCCDFKQLWVCLGCFQNFCLEHLLRHFATCPEGPCYRPVDNVCLCFACETQLMSFHLKSTIHQTSLRTLQRRFSRYRDYSTLEDTLPTADKQSQGVQVDLMPVEFVPESQEPKALLSAQQLQDANLKMIQETHEQLQALQKLLNIPGAARPLFSSSHAETADRAQPDEPSAISKATAPTGFPAETPAELLIDNPEANIAAVTGESTTDDGSSTRKTRRKKKSKE